MRLEHLIATTLDTPLHSILLLHLDDVVSACFDFSDFSLQFYDVQRIIYEYRRMTNIEFCLD
ncbi:hypothetical protein Lal_00019002 [Lupinus albus]|nr:hypothetical protein Lal_00019002 [Lupinus albus]